MRRKQVAAATAGLAVLGAGAWLATTLATGDATTETRDVAAPAPVTTEPSATASATGAAGSPMPSSSAVPSVPVSAAPATPEPVTSSKATREEQIAAVRKLARQPNNQVRRPLPQPVTAVEDGDLTVADTGSLKKDRATLRVVSARQDLTGQRELSTVADAGVPAGPARCTQNFRFGAGAPAVTKPTLLICWRTSAGKSVYTVAVDLDGRPDRDKSVAALQHVWDAMS
ncbi:hypothetical protein [Actinoplanes sp. N902-109]|uniref:hypothetical protein n=1 Tax=Actinoplanes sp. (strain N902-109) TaxID=649831 RepID=UPI0003296121|nr:hypothetical protein [Actinoplanes sp. N902-109]AGL19799.1 hypothetical protein L083_6289 [Actinoplanes sp. N902-109]